LKYYFDTTKIEWKMSKYELKKVKNKKQ